VKKEVDAKRKLYGIARLSMGFAAVFNNGPKPEIMLAIDFRGLFCATFWTSKKWKKKQ